MAHDLTCYVPWPSLSTETPASPSEPADIADPSDATDETPAAEDIPSGEVDASPTVDKTNQEAAVSADTPPAAEETLTNNETSEAEPKDLPVPETAIEADESAPAEPTTTEDECEESPLTVDAAVITTVETEVLEDPTGSTTAVHVVETAAVVATAPVEDDGDDDPAGADIGRGAKVEAVVESVVVVVTEQEPSAAVPESGERL